MKDHSNLMWRGDALFVGRRSRIPAARLIPTPYPHMFRVMTAGGALTDMLNRSRAADAAVALVLADLNRRKTPAEASPIASNQRQAS
jgi:hypothetical protein